MLLKMKIKFSFDDIEAYIIWYHDYSFPMLAHNNCADTITKTNANDFINISLTNKALWK